MRRINLTNPDICRVRVAQSSVFCILFSWPMIVLLSFFFWPLYCLSFFFWPLYCLSFVLFILTIVLSVLRPFYFNHCIVCPSSFFFWPLYCLSFFLFLLTIVLSVLFLLTIVLSVLLRCTTSNCLFYYNNVWVIPAEKSNIRLIIFPSHHVDRQIISLNIRVTKIINSIKKNLRYLI